MANVAGVVAEDIQKTIKLGGVVYDKNGKRVGTVDFVDSGSGYFQVLSNPLSEKDLYVPFRLITNVDPREVYVSVSKDELNHDYANPPARFTAIVDEGGREIASTTEASGYTGLPIVVERVRIDELRSRVAVGYHVYTSEMNDLGKIKEYDQVTGWMLVEKGFGPNKHDLMIPVTIVNDVNRDAEEVYLVMSEADLQRMRHNDPTYVVFPDAKLHEG